MVTWSKRHGFEPCPIIYFVFSNRVRAIAAAMGLRPVIWSRNPQTGLTFDTGGIAFSRFLFG